MTVTHQDLISEQEQEDQRLYLIHHMHHFKMNDDALHELHHCSLFSKPNLEGKKYIIKHLVFKEKLYHILDKKPQEVLYDHLGNQFHTKELEINGQKYYTFS